MERLTAIGRSAPASLIASLTASLDEGRCSFRRLWDTLVGARGYLSAVGPGEHGPAASAYRALMAVREPRDLGKHLWLLSRRAVARTHTLVRAKDRVAEAFFAIARTSPKLAGKWLSRQYHPIAYWALVLDYNAWRLTTDHRRRDHRGDALILDDNAWRLTTGEPRDARPGEQPVRRSLPDPEGLSLAWSMALIHGDRGQRSLLHSLQEACESAPDVLQAPGAHGTWRPHAPLFCPAGWN